MLLVVGGGAEREARLAWRPDLGRAPQGLRDRGGRSADLIDPRDAGGGQLPEVLCTRLGASSSSVARSPSARRARATGDRQPLGVGEGAQDVVGLSVMSVGPPSMLAWS